MRYTGLSVLLCIPLFFTSLSTSAQQERNIDFYLNQAFVNSPLLKDYINQSALSGLDSLLAKSAYHPQIGFNAGGSYAPVIRGYGYDQVITNISNLSATVGVRQTVFGGKSRNAEVESVRWQAESVKNTAKISEQELKRAVIDQYLTAYGDLQQLNFNRETNALLVKEESVLKLLTEKNVYRQTDYLSFLVNRQQQTYILKQLEIQYHNDCAMLNYLCGIADTASVVLPAPDIVQRELPDISQSVFFNQFTIDSLKLANSRILLGNPYRPKIDVFADAGYLSSLTYHPYRNFGANIGFSLSIPIYDGKQRSHQYKKIDIEEKTRQGYKDFFEKQYNQQTMQLKRQLRETGELIGQVEEQIKYAEALVAANNKLLETGDVTIADYVLALNNYLTAKYLLTQNSISQLQIINQLNYWNR